MIIFTTSDRGHAPAPPPLSRRAKKKPPFVRFFTVAVHPDLANI
jgi:hypothetical protein